MEPDERLRALRREILFARQRVYRAGRATPLQRIADDASRPEIHVKREDLSPINAYKWRGAFNRMALLTAEERERGVAAASAGNHAQGVALAARKLGTRARIFMPQSTPRMKQRAVQRLGGDAVEVRLVGDTYDAASAEAQAHIAATGAVYIHAYDDLAVMAGQGTLADEIVMSGDGPFDVAFLQVGGGGMAAATATWLKHQFPGIRTVGVEGVGQASMAAAIEAGAPTSLAEIDVFCDGTAVRKAGALPYAICRETVDEWMTVTNEEVSAAIQFCWEELRCIPEPSGAMGVAAALKRGAEFAGRRAAAILCGANIDFEHLATVARRASFGSARRRFLKIEIPERPGAMLGLLEELPESVNIVEFQYGKTHPDRAAPVVGFEASPPEFDALRAALQRAGFSFAEVTNDADVEFRLIHYEASLLNHPWFITLEFHERPGALAGFLREIGEEANLCYFNYAYSGERVGRALMGFEFPDETARDDFRRRMGAASGNYRAFRPIPDHVAQRIWG